MRTAFFIPLLLHIILSACTTERRGLNNELMTVRSLNVPVLVEKTNNNIANIHLHVTDSLMVLSSVAINFTKQSPASEINELKLSYQGMADEDKVNDLFGKYEVNGLKNKIEGSLKLKKGTHQFLLSLNVKNSINISQEISIESIKCCFSNGTVTYQTNGNKPLTWRIGNIVRAANQDNCHTYRIPGLITTNKGTLIAVYDNRYNNSKDLQEDIDVGMSRSSDGGQTWEPMKVIMDMGEWGGLSQQLNGIGDPCVLYDHHTHTIWVTALWLHGSGPDKMAWWDSKPGMKPGETGQFMLVKSTDDGLTWSAPVNITKQIKDPAWQLLLQGPGRGITLEDGTLVFPAQFKADIGQKALDGGQYTCHSTIIYSKDQGQTWHIGTGAKSNTTEAQVATLADGSLMLNMRDDRNRKDKSETNGRAIATTNNLGQTWHFHPTSNWALPESNCMASLISTTVKIDGQTKHILFFSNPNNKQQRTNMTIKASLDNGMTWPYALELNEQNGFGYSCLTLVDNEHIGILYEGVKELYFQKIGIEQIITK